MRSKGLLRGPTFKELGSRRPYRGRDRSVRCSIESEQLKKRVAAAASKRRPQGKNAPTRAQALPDVPAVGELIPGYEASQWFGLLAPRGTSAEIIDKLNAEIDAGLADTQLQGRLVELGETVLARSAAEFGRRIRGDADKWAKVIRKI